MDVTTPEQAKSQKLEHAVMALKRIPQIFVQQGELQECQADQK